LKVNIPKLLLEVQRRLKRPIPGDSLPKIVVFSSFTQSCSEIIRLFTDCFGKDAIAANQSGQTRSQIEENLNRFKKDPNCFILVCDFSGEEGLNLQFVDYTIHFDLPWSPNRLEQRIGRVDRIGRSLNVEFTVFAGVDLPDSFHDAWFSLLKEGFNIFQQSIASLQFYVDEKLPTLAKILFRTGAAGLLEGIELVKQEIIEEQIKISEQNAIDEIDALDHSSTEYFQSLDDYDARHQEMQQVTEDWICSVLHFKHISNPNISGAKHYQANERTLIPADDLKNNFANSLEGFGTFNRSIANQNPEFKLYRIGEKCIESLFSYINWDDRGKTYAMWRFDETWDSGEGKEWYGFRFNYVVETNIPNQQKKITNSKILQRRVDGLFPPFVRSICIDAKHEPMSVVQDQKLLNILQLPYKSKGTRVQDYNLAKNRLDIIDEFVEPSKWQEICTSARQRSLDLIVQQPDFSELCQKSSTYAEQKLGRRLEQLRLRLNRLRKQGQSSHVALEQELNNEIELSKVIIEGIKNPLIRLDSVGFIIVSGRQPAQIDED
jgi:ATP-dependent helicase HepA